MRWYSVTDDLSTEDLKYPVLLLDSRGQVRAFVDKERLVVYLHMASMGLEPNFPITHWAHFNLPPKPRKPKKTENDASEMGIR